MPNHQNQSVDEINLPGFKKIIKQFFYFLFWLWAFLASVLRRHKLLVIAGLLAGLLLGYIYYVSRPTYYKVTMIVQNNELTRRTYGEMIRQLNNQVRGGAKSNLAKALNTTDEIARRILFVEGRTMGDAPLISDTSTRTRQPFRIIAGLSDNQEVDTIQALLIRYLNNRPYLKTLREEQTRLYYDRLTFINAELQKLDSLENEYNRFLASSKISATFYNNAFNPADIYQQSYNLFNQREVTLRWLYIDKDAVTVIDGFKSPATPHSIVLIKAMVILGAAGFIIAYLLGFLIETKKKLV
jgi:hypothetical protein